MERRILGRTSQKGLCQVMSILGKPGNLVFPERLTAVQLTYYPKYYVTSVLVHLVL